MEERYVKVSRGSEHRNGSVGRREAPRQEGPKRPKGGRSRIVSVIMAMYKVVFVLSAIIVVAYAGIMLKAKPPEQAQQPTPPDLADPSNPDGAAAVMSISITFATSTLMN